jgi:hypothetical protein
MIENRSTLMDLTVGQTTLIQVMFLYTFQLVDQNPSYGLVRHVKLWI